jgi:hypothetical protein
MRKLASALGFVAAVTLLPLSGLKAQLTCDLRVGWSSLDPSCYEYIYYYRSGRVDPDLTLQRRPLPTPFSLFSMTFSGGPDLTPYCPARRPCDQFRWRVLLDIRRADGTFLTFVSSWYRQDQQNVEIVLGLNIQGLAWNTTEVFVTDPTHPAFGLDVGGVLSVSNFVVSPEPETPLILGAGIVVIAATAHRRRRRSARVEHA